MTTNKVAIIGAGPAGLMAAEQLAQAGCSVHVYDAMPSVARKFLLAGVGGMNITHAEPHQQFVQRYREAEPRLRPILDAFPAETLRAWIHDLGIDTFIGSSQRVFPTDMKAAPLLRAWLHRLRQQGVTFHSRHRCLGWQQDEHGIVWEFAQSDQIQQERFAGVVLALGGASWSKLGSDGRWTEWFTRNGIAIAPLQASNCGFELPWSDFLKERYAGTPIKHVALRLAPSHSSNHATSTDEDAKIGEFIISHYGLEGSLVYALSAPLRQRLQHAPNDAFLIVDWLPHNPLADIQKKLAQPRKGMSFANVLRKKLNLPAICVTLLKECLPELNSNDPAAVAQALKAMPLPNVTTTRPIDEAISCAGGVCFSAVNEQLMLTQLPGVFIAGEMLDWEAPTGGYLLTACFATGKHAGQGLRSWLDESHR